MLDRFLVIAEKQKIPAVIVANKIDLVEDAGGNLWPVRSHRLPVIYTSAKDGRGLENCARDAGRARSARWPGRAVWENPAC